jgi:hypothetical protein
MKAVILIFSFILAVNLSYGQKQKALTSEQKNKIILKVTSQPSEGVVHPLDVVLSRYENIYSAKIDPETGYCEIIADDFVTIDIINKDLAGTGYSVELLTLKLMTKEELVNEGILDKSTYEQQQK